jgi:hypothetical protein
MPPAVARIPTCSSQSVHRARPCPRSRRPGGYASSARCRHRACAGRWTPDRFPASGAAPQRKNGAPFCGRRRGADRRPLELRAAQAAVPPPSSPRWEPSCRASPGGWRACSTGCGRSPAGYTPRPRSCPSGGSGRRSRRWPPVRCAGRLDLHAGRRLPGPVEVAAFYAVSEALANVAKHAHASVVHVELGTPGAILQLTVRDDGAGGADPPPAPAAAALTPARAPARRGGQRSRPGITADSRHLLLLTGVR